MEAISRFFLELFERNGSQKKLCLNQGLILHAKRRKFLSLSVIVSLTERFAFDSINSLRDSIKTDLRYLACNIST